ncbi:MAG: flagellar basal body P-ring protein FlgI [Deltaproteobacteria bacterium]|nr:flagellar basal body P-ring protein FlgI [Deltaproteobacteria bacterium]
MTHARCITILVLTVLLAAAAPASAIRLKDMASVRGVRSNQLVGYGLVVGLNGTGDKDSTVFTNQGLANMLTRLGVKVSPDGIKVKNVAAVMITAELPAFARLGNRLDVTLSSMGDSTSLAGGTLVLTPLKGVDGQVYATAQGPVSVGGFQASGAAASVSKNHPTVGRIPSGGLVEREIPYQFGQERVLTVNLDTPDFTSANRVATAIAKTLPELKAQALDSGTVRIELPPNGTNDVSIMARLERLDIVPDASAKVVMDERTGTVVMGEAVRINTVAVASGSLSISISEGQEVSQALPFAPGGETVVTPTTDVQVNEQKASLKLVDGGVSIGDVVRGLNALGATPRDLIVILQAIKAAGALQADLEII